MEGRNIWHGKTISLMKNMPGRQEVEGVLSNGNDPAIRDAYGSVKNRRTESQYCGPGAM